MLNGAGPIIHPTANVVNSGLGSWTEIGPYCQLEETSFGDYSYAADNVSIIYAEIGKFCSLASHVRINPGNHPMSRVTQHHFTYRRVRYGFDKRDDEDVFLWRRKSRCVLGHDVWVGHGSTIMPGVKIGTGAVIGAGAVVTRDVEPYEIVAGVPARFIRKRFTDEVIGKLMKISWWEWDRETIKKRFDDFLDIEAFVGKYFV